VNEKPSLEYELYPVTICLDEISILFSLDEPVYTIEGFDFVAVAVARKQLVPDAALLGNAPVCHVPQQNDFFVGIVDTSAFQGVFEISAFPIMAKNDRGSHGGPLNLENVRDGKL